MTRRRSAPWLCSQLMLALLAGRAAVAQKAVIGMTGAVYRYLGDTIWVERDTSLTRTILNGDTVTSSRWIDGRLRTALTYVLRGDSAYIVLFADSTGVTRPMPTSRAVPARVVMAERQMLEMELRSASARQQFANTGADRLQPPAMPEPPRTYKVSSVVAIVQHLDTIRYVRGCAPLGRVDTTIFLLFARDSVRRLSTPPRPFGQAMRQSLIAQERLAIGMEFTAGLDPATVRDLPGVRDQCETSK